ncbi:MAG: 2-hydroxyacyl-CoA dehydratase family protein [Candidatus Omnitrophica bacterium]|nr:2-hydroxyacyl-CoA dehydratase family protein [Candidatus Omnitrophota bacterium]
MANFYQLFRQSRINRASIGYFCHLIPEEIILAAGLQPVRLCVTSSSLARSGEEIVSAECCPVIKSILGLASSDFLAELPLLVIPGSCDGKMKLAELLSARTEVYFLDLGRGGEYTSGTPQWAEKFKQLLHFLKKRYQVSITRQKIIQACSLTNARTAAFRSLYQFRAHHPGVISAIDYFVITSASFISHPKVWTEQTNTLLEEAAGLPPSHCQSPRILLAGSPIVFPAFKILEVMDEAGLEVAAELTCSGYGHLFDPVQIDEETEDGLLRALALKYVAGSLCPCFLNLNKLADRMISLAEEYKIDAVIYYILRLCQVYELQATALRQILKDKGIPFFSIKTDLEGEDRGQLRTRLEAFREMIGGRSDQCKAKNQSRD